MRRREFLAVTSAPTLLSAANPDSTAPVDFRYAPLAGQTAICFPDDPHKSLVGENGELRYRYSRGSLTAFGVAVAFSLRGMEKDAVMKQWLEAPGTPIVHTRIERPTCTLELIAFATDRPGEGRVDNVIAEVRPRSAKELRASLEITLRTRSRVAAKSVEATTPLEVDGQPFGVADCKLSRPADVGSGWSFTTPPAVATSTRPLRHLFRFPQAGQPTTTLPAAEQLLSEAREYWRRWKPFAGPVKWSVPGRYAEFLTACARNIVQAREMRNGRLTFQVGPTVYRGLWVVDGHFILEAARYLGYDSEAQQGLQATWAQQDAEGGIFAGGGASHWKDTGIAMFSLVRQAELSQDWTYFREMKPQVLRAIQFLRNLQTKAREEDSACGRYNLLPNGVGDGGLNGRRPEFTNTLWVLAGLKAVVQAAREQALTGFEEAEKFYRELSESCFRAMRQEMRRDPRGFDYLPMLMKEDPQWNDARRVEPAAASSGPMGAVACHLSGSASGPERPHRGRAYSPDAGMHSRGHSRGDRLAAARRSLELQCRFRGAGLSLGWTKRSGTHSVSRLPESCVSVVLLA